MNIVVLLCTPWWISSSALTALALSQANWVLTLLVISSKIECINLLNQRFSIICAARSLSINFFIICSASSFLWCRFSPWCRLCFCGRLILIFCCYRFCSWKKMLHWVIFILACSSSWWCHLDFRMLRCCSLLLHLLESLP